MPGSNPFRLPKDGLIYVNKINERCEDLINHSVWTGIEIKRLRKWLSNFKTNTEKYFAACVLDSLIYRSEPQTLALIQQLFLRTLPDLNRTHPTSICSDNNWMEIVNKHKLQIPDPGFRFVTVVKNSDPHSKSAHVIARYIKRNLHVNENLIIKPWEIKDYINKGIMVFLFIDDFLGTGVQFCEFIEKEDIARFLPQIYAAYIPLTAHEIGISKIQQRFSNLIKVTAVEILDNSHRLFHDECSCFQEDENTPTSAKQFYYDLLKNKAFNIEDDDRRGFGCLELAYVFSHAVPDNCLPILWWNNNPNWHPLFDR